MLINIFFLNVNWRHWGCLRRWPALGPGVELVRLVVSSTCGNGKPDVRPFRNKSRRASFAKAEKENMKKKSLFTRRQLSSSKRERKEISCNLRASQPQKATCLRKCDNVHLHKSKIMLTFNFGLKKYLLPSFLIFVLFCFLAPLKMFPYFFPCTLPFFLVYFIPYSLPFSSFLPAFLSFILLLFPLSFFLSFLP